MQAERTITGRPRYMRSLRSAWNGPHGLQLLSRRLRERRALRSLQLPFRIGYTSTGNQLQTVEPEFASNRASSGNSGDAHHNHLRVWAGHKTATDLLPEICILQVVAHEEGSLAIKVLESETRATRAIHIAGFIEGRELVGRVRFNSDHMADARIFDPGSIKDYS